MADVLNKTIEDAVDNRSAASQADEESMATKAEDFLPGQLSPQDPAPYADEEPETEGEEEEEEELSEDLINAFKSLATKMSSRDQFNRRYEIFNSRRARFFWRGMQYLVFNNNRQMWGTPGLMSAKEDSGEGEESFKYVHNIYQSYGKTVMAVITQALPAVRFFPDNPADPNDVRGAKMANKMKRVFERDNNIEQFLIDAAYFMWTDGRVAAYTRPVADAQSFGYEQDGVTPKVQERSDVYGVLEVKVPLTQRQQSEYAYLNLSIEVDISRLKAQYPKKADKLKAGSTGAAEDQYARTARVAIVQGTELLAQGGDSMAHLVTWSRFWFRPSSFMEIEDEAVRAEMFKSFPKGAFIAFGGDTYLESKNQCMDDCWSILNPLPGDGQNTPALGASLIPLQEEINNLENMCQQMYETGLPLTYADTALFDVDANKEQHSLPNGMVPVRNPNPQIPLGNYMFKEQPGQVTAEVINRLTTLKNQDAQNLSSAQPAMFGGNMPDQKTASVYAMARDQAMGVMGLVYRPFKKWYASIVNQAVRCAMSRQSDINTLLPSERNRKTYDNVQVGIDELKSGKYHCHPESDENFPETWSQQRASFQLFAQFAGQDPEFQSILMHPDNQHLIKKLTGLDELEIPGADSRDKQLREIDELLEDGPIAPTQEEIQKVAQDRTLMMGGGQPVPPVDPEEMMRPSVQIDPIFDNHQFEFLEVQRWVNSDEGYAAKVSNPQGYENVRLHGLAHYKAMNGGPNAAKPLQEQTPNPQAAIAALKARQAMRQGAAQPQQAQPQPPATPGGEVATPGAQPQPQQ